MRRGPKTGWWCSGVVEEIAPRLDAGRDPVAETWKLPEIQAGKNKNRKNHEVSCCTFM